MRFYLFWNLWWYFNWINFREIKFHDFANFCLFCEMLFRENAWNRRIAKIIQCNIFQYFEKYSFAKIELCFFFIIKKNKVYFCVFLRFTKFFRFTCEWNISRGLIFPNSYLSVRNFSKCPFTKINPKNLAKFFARKFWSLYFRRILEKLLFITDR